MTGAVGDANTNMSNYNIAYVNRTGNTIDKADLTINVTQQSKTYDGTTNVAVTNVSPGVIMTGLVSGENVTYNLAFANKNAGSNKTVEITNITAAQNTSLDNYNVVANNNATSTITAKVLNITAQQQTKVYDGTTSANQSKYSSDGLISGEAISSVVISYADKNAGSNNKVVNIGNATAASNTDIANYDVRYIANTTSTITKANLTAVVNNDSKIVTQTDAAGYNGISYSGFVNGENYTTGGLTGGTITRANMTTNQSAGTYNNVLGTSDLASNNYNIAVTKGNYTINAADQLAIKVTNANVTYGTTANYTIASAQYLNQANVIANLTLVSKVGNIYTYADGVGGSVSFTIDPINGAVSGSNNLKVGVYQLQNNNTQITGNNFNVLTLTGALTVEKKQISIGSANVSKTYEGNSLITSSNITNLTLSGVVTGDQISIQSVNGTYADKNAGTNKQYNLTLGSNVSGVDSSNYYINTSAVYNGNNGVIDKATITAVSNISVSNKIYDGTTNASFNSSGAILTGKIAGDNLTLANGTAVFADKNAGTNKSVTVSNYTLSGDAANNYNLQPSASTYTGQANIGVRAINVIAGNQDKTYDGTTNVTNSSAFSVSNIVNGESIGNVTLNYDSKQAGDTSKTIYISNATQGANTNLSNYQVSYVHSTGNTISKATITAINNITVSDKTYDGTKTALIDTNNATFVGKMGNDSLSVSGGTGGFTSKDAGANVSVVVSNFALSGSDAGNYILQANASGFNGSANITTKELRLTANAQTKTYDGTTSVANASGFSTDGLVTYESIASVSLAYTNRSAGANKVISISNATASTGTLLSNYNITYVNSSSSAITQLSLTSATGITAQDKKYDGTRSAILNTTGASFVGVISGDQVNFGNATGLFDTANVGTNKNVVVSNFSMIGNDAGNYDVSNLALNLSANITSNGGIAGFDLASTLNYESSLKLNQPNVTLYQFDSSMMNETDQLGIPTFNSFIQRKKTGQVLNETIKVTASGVNKNIR